MKAIILAGGNGTRLRPLTNCLHKSILPIFNKPMIFYSLEAIAKTGIKDVIIIISPIVVSTYLKLVGSGARFGLNVSFKVQENPMGISHAILECESEIKGHNVLVYLSDNIFGPDFDFSPAVANFNEGCELFFKKVPDPQRFGVPTLDGRKVLRLTEKPEKPDSDYACVGLYIFDTKACEYIKTLEPSARGEYEVTDLNNIYIQDGAAKANFLDAFWSDAGTHDSLHEANEYFYNLNK